MRTRAHLARLLGWLAQLGSDSIKREVPVTRNIDQKEIVRLFLKFDDLKSLGDIALLGLAQTAQLNELDEGQHLSADLQKDRHLYLIDGKIELRAQEKNPQIIVANSDQTRQRNS